MHTPQPLSTRLLPQQTRVIHASEGLRLRVVAGRLWLTQPNALQDLILGPGDVVVLVQDWVVVGADVEPGGQSANQLFSCAYELQPLSARQQTQGMVVAIQSAIAWWRRRVLRGSVAEKIAQRA